MPSRWAAPLILGLCGSALGASFPQEPQRRGTPDRSGPISFPVIQERHVTTNTKIKRAVDTDVQVYNVSSISYLIELDIGTPGQAVKVAIDTGSSELWVNPNCATAQSRQQSQDCLTNGQYDPTKSSSAKISQQRGYVKYGIGEVNLQYVSDDIALPGSAVDISNVIFGHAVSSEDLNQGILGLSFGEGFNMEYKSVIDEMFAQGVTKARAFGVALGLKDETAHKGLLSFGGVDTKKFMGKLHTSPILEPASDGLYRYWVALSSVGITKNGQAKTYPNSSTPVFFDTGATLSYLPRGIVEQLVTDLGATYSRTVGLYVLPCGQQGSVDFTFDNFTINVDLEEFIWELENGQCALGAEATDDGSYILGDSFLRSVYSVFDIDSLSIHFAKYVNCGSNLQEIPAGDNAAAQFTGECSQEDVDKAGSRQGGGNGDDDNAAPRISGAWLTAGALIAVQLIASLL